MSASLRGGRAALAVTRKFSATRTSRIDSYQAIPSSSTNFVRSCSGLEAITHLVTSTKYLQPPIPLPDCKARIQALTISQNRLFSTSTIQCQAQEKLSNESFKEPTEGSKTVGRQKTNTTRLRKGAKDRKESSVLINDRKTGVTAALQNLNLITTKTGRVYLGSVRGIFDRIQQGWVCTSNDALLLLRCCGHFMKDEKPSTRAEVSEKLWSYYKDTGVTLDVSHYNTLLKNRLDNALPEFQPTEFLGIMEENGIEANRVTFQHLIAKYCSMGDISGATTILEYMKDKKLPINEHVFHSLIIGHCRGNDFESAKGVMEAMVASNLEVGSDTKMIYIMELARAKKDFKAELDQTVGEDKATFSDNDYFKLIVLLLENGEKELASAIAERLPKKAGFFQEMRNFIPAMIAAGEIELPFKIMEGFKITRPGKGDSEQPSGNPSLFFLRAMVKNEYDPKDLLESADKINGGNETTTTAYILEQCMNHGNVHYGKSVSDEMIKKYGKVEMSNDQQESLIAKRVTTLKNQHIEGESTDSILQFLVDLREFGVRLSLPEVSNIILPAIMKGTEAQPKQIVRLYKEKTIALGDAYDPKTTTSWVLLGNTMIRHLVKGDEKAVGQAIDLMFYMIYKPPNTNAIKNPGTLPSMWSNVLANSRFVNSPNFKDSLVTILGLNSYICDQTGDKEQRIKKDEALFQTLNHIATLGMDRTPEEVLLPVITELRDLNVGVPESVATALLKSVGECSKEFTSAMNQVADNYKNNQSYWTEDNVDNFYNSRKLIHKDVITSNASNEYIPINSNGFIAEDKIPADTEGLEKIQQILDKKNLRNDFITNKLVSSYLNNKKFKEADDCINKLLDSSSESKDRKIWPQLVNDYVNACTQQKDLDKAISLFERIGNLKSNRIWTHSLVNLALSLITQDEHEKLLELLKKVDASQLTCTYSTVSVAACRIPNEYADQGDKENYEKVLEVLQDAKIITSKRGLRGVGEKINFDSEDFSLEESVNKIEDIVKEENRLPRYSDYFKLLDLLIKDENMEGLRRVLDASINVIGETNALFNLACALLESGKKAQAKKLLATPGLRYEDWKVSWIMQRFAKLNKLAELEKFVSFCLPVFACDRESMYSGLVSACVENKEVNRIEDAWVNMQEEGFAPSETLKIVMAKAFKAEGLSIPFAVPEIAEDVLSHTEIPKNLASPEINKRNKTDEGKENVVIDSALQSALDQKDLDSVMTRYKSLAEKFQLTKQCKKLVANFIDLEGDENKKRKAMHTILTDKAFNSLAEEYKFKLDHIADGFSKAELEAVISNISNDRLLVKYKLTSRVHGHWINEDLEGYMNSLESLKDGSDGYIPTDKLLTKVIEGNPDNAERLIVIASKVIKTKPGFAVNTMRVPLNSGAKNSDMRTQVWQLLKDEGLNILTKRQLLAISGVPDLTAQVKEEVTHALTLKNEDETQSLKMQK